MDSAPPGSRTDSLHHLFKFEKTKPNLSSAVLTQLLDIARTAVLELHFSSTFRALTSLILLLWEHLTACSCFMLVHPGPVEVHQGAKWTAFPLLHQCQRDSHCSSSCRTLNERKTLTVARHFMFIVFILFIAYLTIKLT